MSRVVRIVGIPVKVSALKPPPLPEGLAWWHPAVWLSTWFGSGLTPLSPGTWGSLAALPFAALIAWAGGGGMLAFASLVVFALGVWASGIYSRRMGVADPGAIVIDEVAGQFLTLAVLPLDPWWYLAGFLAFRAADILKPFPANWADRRLKGGLGVMTDDVIAGGYCAIGFVLLRGMIG